MTHKFGRPRGAAWDMASIACLEKHFVLSFEHQGVPLRLHTEGGTDVWLSTYCRLWSIAARSAGHISTFNLHVVFHFDSGF